VRVELTKRADYAIRAVVALAAAAPGERLSVRRIAADRAIPVRFLPLVMTDLVRAGLVEGLAGRTGGYRLARPSSAISILEVIEAIEGDSRRTTCVLRGGPCNVNGVCDVHEVFAATQAAMLRELGGATIASLAARRVRGLPAAGSLAPAVVLEAEVSRPT
jgi:Rrf2 family protein